MAAATDLMKLYSQQILALAAHIPLTDRLDDPMATVRRRSPLCGSTIVVDMDVAQDRVSAYGQDVKACALGQAAASVVGESIVGRTRSEILSARNELEVMLKSDGAVPAPPFSGLEALIPAREYPNRHASILLALDASLEAFDIAEEKSRHEDTRGG
jgi:NifU-like protein involved in Fe-S cluster formation